VTSAAALAVAGGYLIGPRRIIAEMGNDLRALGSLPRTAGIPASIVLALVALTYCVLASAATTSPLLGWDSLHYHLLHVAHWAQDKGFSPHPGVDAWSYYEFLPIGGEILFAWIAIPTRTNVLIGPLGVAFCGMAALSAACAARTLGATPRRSVLAGAALVATPAISMFATNGYVDNLVLALIAAGTALLLEAYQADEQRVRRQLVALAGAAFGLAVGAKLTPIFYVGLGACAIATTLLARRQPFRIVLGDVVAFAAAAAIFVPRLLQVWWRTGSPVYPLSIRLFGRTLVPGNSQLQGLVEGPFPPGIKQPSLFELFHGLFFGAYQPNWPHVNFGISGLLLIGLGAVGLGFWVWSRPRDMRTILLIFIALPASAYIFSSATLGYRLTWWWVVARFMTPALLTAVLLVTAIPGKWADATLGLAALIELYHPLSSGMCGYRWVGAASIVAIGSTFVGLSIVAWRSRHPRTSVALLMSGIAGFVAATPPLRAALNPLITLGALRGECFEAHPLTMGHPVGAFPIWQHLAAMPPKRIAIIAGFDGIGHNVFRYPLLGDQWQHQWTYIAPAADGILRDHIELYRTSNSGSPVRLSFEGWLERLHHERVDYVVLLRPYNVAEFEWVTNHPELFDLEAAGDRQVALLFRVRPRP